MGRESYAFMTGLFVVVLGALVVAGAIWLGHLGEVRDTYLVSTRQAVSGLNPESTVFFRGVAIGKVRAIRLDPEDVRTILIRVEVDPATPVTRGTWAVLRVQPLTGLAQVELNDAGDQPERLASRGDAPERIPMRPSLFDRVTESSQDTLGQLGQFVERVNRLLDEESMQRFRRILAETDSALVQLNRTLSGMDQFSHSARDLALAGARAGETLNDATLPQINDLLRDLQYTSGHLRQLASGLEQDPRALLLGPTSTAPAPGEPGYHEVSP